MSSSHGHQPSLSQNHKAHLASAYNELGKELSSHKMKVVGNYTLGKVIGEGAYGKVRIGAHRLTGTRVAIKQIPKAMSATLTREIHHHRELHHPHIVQLYEVIATESTIWLVAELCSGGELFDYLVEKGRLPEEETRVLFGQLCLAVAFVHSKGIVHRDLKLENVLLDEKCRVKLSDFGFTREYERGTLLETFCGTTGYAAPEMLLAQKYLGPEVDIWSLGIILYSLLTGALPFDDDDDAVMREMIIKGDFEDPEWLSDDARDLIKSILQRDPSKRPSISQILAHSWFTSPSPPPFEQNLTSPSTNSLPAAPISPTSPVAPAQSNNGAEPSEPSSSESSVPGDAWPSTPTTPDSPARPQTPPGTTSIARNSSEKTLSTRHPPLEVLIPPQIERLTNNSHSSRSPAPSTHARIPPPPPTRTPARTKRRSVSSALSETLSLSEKPLPPAPPQDYGALLSKPAPLLFSTKLERDLLNSLSLLGFDTAQMVHSVLSNACDAAGATWWILVRKAELKALEEGSRPDVVVPDEEEKPRRRSTRRAKPETGGGGSLSAMHPTLTHSAPELALVPATPTTVKAGHTTPPRSSSPTTLTFLSPTPSATTVTMPTTPSKDKDKSNTGTGGSKRDSKLRNRSGSVSIMQRATTALEAAGLVRKKSSEAVKDKDKEREKEKEKEKEREKEKEKEKEEKELPAPPPKGDESSRSSHTSSKLTKSPPLRGLKDALLPSTSSLDVESSLTWPHTDSKRVGSPASPEGTGGSISPGDTLTSLPDMDDRQHKGGPNRNRASLLTAFRMWFAEDRKGKRKSVALSPNDNRASFPRSHSSPIASTSGTRSKRGSMKRGASERAAVMGTPGRPGYRNPRASMGSRRSSSVNSRRSSVTSMHMLAPGSSFDAQHLQDNMPPISRQRSDASRRSVGTHTPNSDYYGPGGEYGEYPSRPSSVVSSHPPRRHRKSPSASSTGSGARHRIRTMNSPHNKRGPTMARPPHVRSNSATSMQSLGSSQPGSLYDLSESEVGSAMRPTSPRRMRARRSMDLDSTPRRKGGYAAAFSPRGSSWKKSWGLEPPGWSSRATHAPVEVLAIGPASGDGPMTVRDVFSGRGSLSMGDDDDWVDEDDDVLPAFAGGLGQMSTSANGSSVPSPATPVSKGTSFAFEPSPFIVQPPAKKGTRPNASAGKRNARNSAKAGQPATPVEAPAHEAPEIRATRRQPVGRAAGSFGGIPIQEEEEEEEEE